jgi:hypothetical protein
MHCQKNAEPGIHSAGGPVRQIRLLYLPAKQHKLAESIPWIRFWAPFPNSDSGNKNTLQYERLPERECMGQAATFSRNLDFIILKIYKVLQIACSYNLRTVTFSQSLADSCLIFSP